MHDHGPWYTIKSVYKLTYYGRIILHLEKALPRYLYTMCMHVPVYVIRQLNSFVAVIFQVKF